MSPALMRLEAPPRTIPPMLAAQMLFGGAGAQIGWLIFAFGSIFYWVFGWHADLSGWRFRPQTTATATGISRGCADTRYSIGGTRGRRGTPVYENRYRYTVDGNTLEGRSYDTGTCLDHGEATVEYLSASPGYSRIRGMRHGLLSPWALLVALFPGAGAIAAMLGLRDGRRRIHLLRVGLPTAGRLTESTATGTRVMGKTVYRMTVDFDALDGRTYTAVVRTNQPERLQDQPVKTILYDPGDPDCAIPLDALPGKIERDHMGIFTAPAWQKFLVLPTASLLLNGLFLWSKW